MALMHPAGRATGVFSPAIKLEALVSEGDLFIHLFIYLFVIANEDFPSKHMVTCSFVFCSGRTIKTGKTMQLHLSLRLTSSLIMY